jgi:perosamine synthetase
MACFSFYGGKNMTTGEGGMITTNDETYADILRTIRIHGEERPYWVTRVGHNYRMTEIAAAIGLCQIQKLPEFLKKRRKNAKKLSDELSSFDKLIIPTEYENRKHAWYLYTVRLHGKYARRRYKILQKLHDKKIGATIYYEVPVHMLPLYQKYSDTPLPECEKIAREIFSLPIHPGVNFEDIDYISDILKRIV